ncbi:unnamed protein product [Rotaria sordida]|uniref:Uncharacterized protein n=1 Tax=Rotaria sordida TaxID=392033 RepID=A0A818YHL0_9BILA|nr:unnamed protein product [Rotaria sordida]
MEKKGAFRIYWPPLFPNIWLPECDYMQLDVSVRNQSSPNMPSVEGDDHDYNINNGEKMIFYYDIGDKNYSYDDDNNYGWNDDQQQQQIELSENDVDAVSNNLLLLDSSIQNSIEMSFHLDAFIPTLLAGQSTDAIIRKVY